MTDLIWPDWGLDTKYKNIAKHYTSVWLDMIQPKFAFENPPNLKLYYFWKLFEYWSTIDSCDYWHYETCTFLITDHQKMHYSFWSNLLYLLVLPTSLLVSVLSVMTRGWSHQSWTCPFGFSFDRSGERRRRRDSCVLIVSWSWLSEVPGNIGVLVSGRRLYGKVYSATPSVAVDSWKCGKINKF